MVVETDQDSTSARKAALCASIRSMRGDAVTELGDSNDLRFEVHQVEQSVMVPEGETEWEQVGEN